MHCILCGDPAANFSSTCAVASLIPSCSYFLLPHIFLSLSSILQLLVGSCLLWVFGSRCLALCSWFSVCSSMLSVVFSFWFTCHRSAFGHPLPPPTSPFKDKLNQFPIDRVMRCFFSSIFSWTPPPLPA